jgi:hypothetical protein
MDKVTRNITIETSTIVPPGAISHIYENIIPISTEQTAIIIDPIAVFLNPFPSIMAVILGITINEEIKSTPTNLIEVITVILASTMKR